MVAASRILPRAFTAWADGPCVRRMCKARGSVHELSVRRRTIKPSDINYTFDWTSSVALLCAIRDIIGSHSGLRASYDTAKVSCGSICVVSMSRVTPCRCTIVSERFEHCGAPTRSERKHRQDHAARTGWERPGRSLEIHLHVARWVEGLSCCVCWQIVREMRLTVVDPDSPRTDRADSAAHPLLRQTTAIAYVATRNHTSLCRFQCPGEIL